MLIKLMFSDFFNTTDIPSKEYFFSLLDSPEQLQAKETFWDSIKDINWEFMDQMKRYLMTHVRHLLRASIKLLNYCCDIQRMLRRNYSLQLPIGSIFNMRNSGSFLSKLMIDYSTSELSAPIYSIRNSEKGMVTLVRYLFSFSTCMTHILF